MSYSRRKKVAVIAAASVAFLACGHAVGTATEKNQAVALTHATVIDGSGSPGRSGMTVLISGSRIVSVKPDAQTHIPADADVVDLTGKFVIPGLIDSHVHLGTQPRDSGVMESILNAVFMHGITTVRDMGGSMKIVRPLAESSPHNDVPRPRIFYSAIMAGEGRWFTGPFGENAAGGMEMGKSPLVQRIDSHTNVKQAIAAAKNAGATAIKIYNGIDAKMVKSLADEAHRNGLHVWSHFSVNPARPMDMVTAGTEVVSHADQFRGHVLSAAALGDDSLSRSHRAEEAKSILPDAKGFDNLFAEMKKRRTILDPTLTIMLPRQITDTSRANVDKVLSTFRFAAAMTRRANRAGIPIVAGTDAIGGSTANLHAELQVLVDSAGLTPLQAIRAATLNGAIAVGSADSLGTVAAGKVADIAILCADPSVDIRNTQTVYGVIKGGILYKRNAPPRTGPLAKAPATTCH